MDSFTDDASFLTEYITRKKYIAPLLKSRGWLRSYIKEEVNSVKSDFKNNKIIFFEGNPERKVDRFIDYLLLDINNKPLAIIEAKRFSKTPVKAGSRQEPMPKILKGKLISKYLFF